MSYFTYSIASAGLDLRNSTVQLSPTTFWKIKQ